MPWRAAAIDPWRSFCCSPDQPLSIVCGPPAFREDLKMLQLLLDAGSNPDFQDARGMTALHYMLKKSSDKKHFGAFAQHRARGDIPNADGDTAAALLRRKRDPYLRELASG